MKFLFAHVRPGRLPSGGWTLYEYDYFDGYIPGWRNVRKQRRRVWPPIKRNGRGKVYTTARDAWEAYEFGGLWRA